MKKIKLLDLCCKAGGAARGYELAAIELGYKIEITGIDIEPQPNYPYKFIQADAVDYILKNSHKYTHFHASPPCQPYSVSTARFRQAGKVYRDILEEITEQMYKTNKPGIIENVMPSPVRPDIILRGDSFGLKILKSRKFECVNWFSMKPILKKKIGSVKAGDFALCIGNGQLKVTNGIKFKIPGNSILEVWSYAMGINWMTIHEMAEAIPPAYTHYLGIDFFKN